MIGSLHRDADLSESVASSMTFCLPSIHISDRSSSTPKIVKMAASTATIANNTSGDPEVAHEVTIKTKDSIIRRRRALVGWNHQDDSPAGLDRGKVWCWVSAGNHFQVFDTTCNRSSRPGQVVFCGVANFTMVRMFHPYWCSYGGIPRDMVSKDKKTCRDNYRRLMRRWRAQHGQTAADESEDDDADDREVPRKPTRRGRGRPRGARGTRGGRGGGRGGALRRMAAARQVLTGQETNVPGSDTEDAMNISDDEDCNRSSDDDSDSDSTNDESDDNDLRSRNNHPNRRTVHLASTTSVPETTPGTNIVMTKVEDENTVKIEEEEKILLIDLTSDTDQEEQDIDDDNVDINSDAADEDNDDVIVVTDPNTFADTSTTATLATAGSDATNDSEMFFTSIADENATEANIDHELEVRTEQGIREEPLDITVDTIAKEEARRSVPFDWHMLNSQEIIEIDDD